MEPAPWRIRRRFAPCRAILRARMPWGLEEALTMDGSGELKFRRGNIADPHSAANRATTPAKRYQEAKSLLRRTMPVARRVLGDEDRLTLEMREICTRFARQRLPAISTRP